MWPYWHMVREWDAILAQPLSDEAKQRACLAVLRRYVERMAAGRLGQPNPALRFYADMVMLARDIAPTFGNDDRVKLALRPGSDHVRDWLHRHSQLPTPVGR